MTTMPPNDSAPGNRRCPCPLCSPAAVASVRRRLRGFLILMNLKHWSAVVVVLQLFPLAANAQAAESGRGNSTFAGLLWTFLPIVLLGILLYWFFRFMPRDWKTWAPFQSPDVRKICAHMTEAEKQKGIRKGALHALWVTTTLAIPVSLAVVAPNPTLVIIAAVLIVIHIACLPLWFRRQRRYFCSTSWAREQGFTPERLRLFSFSV